MIPPVSLGVNIDHVATLRQARLTVDPDPLQAARMAEQGGADSITVHLREDRRHIQEDDVRRLKELMGIPVNLEMAAIPDMVEFAQYMQVDYCCLVPERREELTTEGGLDVYEQCRWITSICQQLAKAKIRVSLFIDAEPRQIAAAAKTGASYIELHTGPFSEQTDEPGRGEALQKIVDAVRQATDLGLGVNAGHGLNYHNVQPIAGIPEIHELNIGHSIVSRALFTGFSEAVSEMKRLIHEARLGSIDKKADNDA